MVDNEFDEQSSPPTLSATYQTYIDLDEQSVEWVIFDVIGNALGVDPEERTIPVFETINPEALGMLFTADQGNSHVSFPVWDVQVHIYSDGRVVITPADAEANSF